MVRLVFCPYTQIWRSICTLESLRASIRVYPGFTIFRHSSSSFGSQHMCSHSDLSSEELWPADCASKESNHCYFHYARRFVTSVLAHMLDSLVRVSRRGNENHFVRITSTCVTYLNLIQDKYKQVNTHKGLPPICTFTPEKTHPDRRLTTTSLLQVTGKIWVNWALVSIAYLSAISGTF